MAWGRLGADIRFTRTFIAITALLATANSAQAKAPFVVILDPGHGGEDTGAIRKHRGKKIEEKDVTLKLAKTTARILRQRGVRVVLTRTDDRFVDLDRRTEIANRAARKARSAVFVSIHGNSSDHSRSSGVETYVLNATSNGASKKLAEIENNPQYTKNGEKLIPRTRSHGTLDLILADLAGTANYAASVDLACAVQDRVVQRLESRRHEVRDRGIRQALFYVLMQARMPSILFEPGFLSNPRELGRLLSPTYQRLIATGLADGVLRWRERQRQRRRLAARSGARSVSAVVKPACQIH